LKSEIKKLEEMVHQFNEEINSLDLEAKKIDKNISSIEKMKSEAVEIDIERPRQHNLNNIKKSK
jgi:septal ring factor EnvC (AmiA/AmiB activator)